MTTQNLKEVICQICGRKTPLKEKICRHCGGNPLFANLSDYNRLKEPKEDVTPFEDELNYLRETVQFVSLKNQDIENMLFEMERKLITLRAGFDLIINKMGKNERQKFINKWKEDVSHHYRILVLKDHFLEKKLEIISNCPFEKLSQFEELILKAQDCFNTFYLEEAFINLNSALKLTPQNIALIPIVAQVLFEMGKLNEAKEVIFSAITEGNTSKEILKLATIVSLSLGKKKDASKYLEMYLKQSDEAFEGLILKACIEAEMGKWGEVAKWSKRALSKKKNLFAVLMLSFSLIMQKKFAQSRKMLEEAIKIDPENSDLLLMLHGLYLLNGYEKEATKMKKNLTNSNDKLLCQKREKYFMAKEFDKLLKTLTPPIEKFIAEMNVFETF